MLKFSFDTITEFDSHIEMSIPNYKHIWELINTVSSYFITPNTSVYDLGCSTGLGLKILAANTPHENVKFIGYDVSDNMVKDASISQNYVIQNVDITNENVNFPNASLIMMVFTLQFLPPGKKLDILKRIFDSLLPGGAFIVCEKIFSDSGRIQDIFTFSHYDLKGRNFTEDEILRKQHDLRSLMKNNTSNEIEYMLERSGFSTISSFFQSLQFKGWICVK